MRLEQPGYKSWFLLGGKVVMLGTGIAATGANTVESTVENRKLGSTGDNVRIINGQTMPVNPRLVGGDQEGPDGT